MAVNYSLPLQGELSIIFQFSALLLAVADSLSSSFNNYGKWDALTDNWKPISHPVTSWANVALGIGFLLL